MTPASFNAYVSGYLDAEQQKKKVDLQIQDKMVYNLACLVRIAIHGKKIPKYHPNIGQKKKHMTDEEMFKEVSALTIAMGGEIKET